MADENGQLQSASAASTAAILSEGDPLQVLVAPSIADEFNTVVTQISPKACFKLEDSHFEFDSSFVNPLGLTFDAGPLKALMDKHPGAKLSIFGHADPVGRDDYNKMLSGRRAQAIFGMLVRDAALWEDLYFHHDNQGKDKWGVKAIQIMLNLAGPTPAGTADGIIGTKTKTALKDFESANGLPAKGFNQKEEVDPATFKKLALLYMDKVCLDDDGNPFQLTPDDFLARGKGKDGKGDFQGCGEFNPLLIFSKEEDAFFNKEQNKKRRNQENQPNRRVMILLYRPGTQIDPAKWPCPSVKEGVAGCKKRFFANADERRSNLDTRREHKDEKTNPDMVGTFACRFYDRQNNNSPCERILETFQLKLFDEEARVIPFAPFVVIHGGAVTRGRADGEALLTVHDIKVPATCKVKWRRPQVGEGTGTPAPKVSDPFEFELDVFVDIPADDDSDEVALQRLNNLGYTAGPTQQDNITDFQRDYKSKLPDTTLKNSLGKLDEPTKNVLRDVHDSADPLVKSASLSAQEG